MATMTEPKAENKTLVHFMVEGGVAIIELDDAPANTYTYEMMRQLDEAILRARFDDDVHVVVLRGHGDKFFSAGANIGMLNSVTPRFKFFFCLHANETLNRLEQTPKLTIAALNGHTVGGGLEIAMACDIRLAKENAGKIGLPEVNLGVLPGTGGTQRLARLVGKARAIELMAKGELFSFDRAKELGIVNEIFPAKEFWEQVMLYAKQFCPPHKASKAVGLISGPCRRAPRSPSSRRSPWSANCSSSCSRARTRRRASPPTSRSGSRSSGAGEDRPADRERMAQHRQALPPHQSGDRGTARRGSRGGRGGDRRGRADGARLPRLEGVARAGGAQARPAVVSHRGTLGAALPGNRRSRNEEQRQAAVRVEDRRRDGCRNVPLLRRLGRQAHGRHAPRKRQLLHLHPARAGGRGGCDRAVELPAEPRLVEGGPGARGRVHGRLEARARDAAHRPAARRDRGRGGAAAGRP